MFFIFSLTRRLILSHEVSHYCHTGRNFFKKIGNYPLVVQEYQLAKGRLPTISVLFRELNVGQIAEWAVRRENLVALIFERVADLVKLGMVVLRPAVLIHIVPHVMILGVLLFLEPVIEVTLDLVGCNGHAAAPL